MLRLVRRIMIRREPADHDRLALRMIRMRILFLSQSPEDPADREENARVQQLLRSYASPGTELDLGFPDDFPGARVMVDMGAKMQLTGLHHAMETPALVQKAVWAEQNGYDAVVQSNTFDPGVESSRLAVRIPVVGILRTNIHAAAMLADRIGITVPLDGHVPYTWRILRQYGMDDFVTDIRPIGMYGSDLVKRRDELHDRAMELMRGLVRDGAHCLLPLGGALIPYVVSPEQLQSQLGLPVLNTKLIAIRFAETLVRAGLSHSPLTYPRADIDPAAFIRPQAS
jgi:Asp/Glu/hydantoin racemase